MALLSDMVPIRGKELFRRARELCSDGVGQEWGKSRIVLLGQVDEKGNRRAELKAENEARIRGGVCMWERA